MKVYCVKNKAGRTLRISASNWLDAIRIAKQAGLVRNTSNCREEFPYYHKDIDHDSFKPNESGVIQLQSDGKYVWYTVCSPYFYKRQYNRKRRLKRKE
jgi:hypothetical protein